MQFVIYVQEYEEGLHAMINAVVQLLLNTGVTYFPCFTDVFVLVHTPKLGMTC
jgi:hypothetical protein